MRGLGQGAAAGTSVTAFDPITGAAMAFASAIGNTISNIFFAKAQVKVAKEQRKAAVRVAAIRGKTAVTLGLTRQETITAVVPLAVGITALFMVTRVLK